MRKIPIHLKTTIQKYFLWIPFLDQNRNGCVNFSFIRKTNNIVKFCIKIIRILFVMQLDYDIKIIS